MPVRTLRKMEIFINTKTIGTPYQLNDGALRHPMTATLQHLHENALAHTTQQKSVDTAVWPQPCARKKRHVL